MGRLQHEQLRHLTHGNEDRTQLYVSLLINYMLLVPCELQEWECRVEYVPSALTPEQSLVHLVVLSHCSNCFQMIQQMFWLISFVREKTQRKRNKPKACFGVGMSWQQVKCFKHNYGEMQSSVLMIPWNKFTYNLLQHQACGFCVCLLPSLGSNVHIQERKQHFLRSKTSSTFISRRWKHSVQKKKNYQFP